MSRMAARLLYVGALDPDGGWRMESPGHPHHELIVVFRGLMHVTIGGQTLAGRPGDILFYPAGSAHRERSDAADPVATRFIGFEWELPVRTAPLCIADRQGRVRQLAGWLHDEWGAAPAGARPAMQAFFAALLAEWLRLLSHQDHVLVAAIHGYIASHLRATVRLDDLARVAGMSKFHFVRAYRRLTMRTPLADVRALRLRHAQHLLLTTDLPLKDIAPQCGLASEYHLCRIFRRYLNATPGEIRASRR